MRERESFVMQPSGRGGTSRSVAMTTASREREKMASQLRGERHSLGFGKIKVGRSYVEGEGAHLEERQRI